MPAIDEDTLRDLMHHSTGDLHAPPAAFTADVCTRYQRRRQRRTRALGVAAAGVAAGTAFGVLAATSGGPGQAPASPAGPAITLTAAQRTLEQFSSVAARSPQARGRYVVFTEKAGNPTVAAGDYTRTSVIDSRNGDVWTYQKGAGVPGQLPVDRHGSMTQAQYNALPTTEAGLRAALLAQAARDQAAAQRALKEAVARRGAARLGKKALRHSILRQSSSDKVFEEASLMLWNPLVSPALRAALFRLLADTPGVLVSKDAKDSSGRPAVEISRHQTYGPVNEEIFESPAGTGVLETADIWPQASEDTSDLYLSITRSAALPASPYRR